MTVGRLEAQRLSATYEGYTSSERCRLGWDSSVKPPPLCCPARLHSTWHCLSENIYFALWPNFILSPLLCLFLCYILLMHLLQLLQCNQFLCFCLRYLRFWLLIARLSHCHKTHEPSDLSSGPDLPPFSLTLTSTWPPRLVAGLSAASHRHPGFTWLRL